MTDQQAIDETFPYPDAVTAEHCEKAALCVEELNSMLVRWNVEGMIEMGRQLNKAAVLLKGQFGRWLAWRLPWCEEVARKWRVLAQRVDCLGPDEFQKFLELLHRFRSTTAILEFVRLDEPAQRAVVEAEAWSWTEFAAVKWGCDMRDLLTDEKMEHGRRYGVARHEIDEILHDESAPEPLKREAEALYRENRETFARLEDEPPEVVDVEVGYRWKEPDGDRPSAQLVEGDEGLWLCRWDGERFHAVAPVSSHVLMWPGPEVLAAFPRTNGSAGAASWQKAGVRAMCEKLGASTLEKTYGEVL